MIPLAGACFPLSLSLLFIDDDVEVNKLCSRFQQLHLRSLLLESVLGIVWRVFIPEVTTTQGKRHIIQEQAKSSNLSGTARRTLLHSLQPLPGLYFFNGQSIAYTVKSMDGGTWKSACPLNWNPNRSYMLTYLCCSDSCSHLLEHQETLTRSGLGVSSVMLLPCDVAYANF